MDPNFVYPAILKNQDAPSYNVPDGSIGLFASGNKLYIQNSNQEISGLIDSAEGQLISGYAITGFDDAITGLSVTGSTTKTITLFQRDGTTVTGAFTDIDGTAFGVIVFAANGGGSTITTGYKSFTTMTYAGQILEYTLLADQTGSVVIDIWKDTYANYPPTSGDSICATNKVTLATGIKNTDSTLTSWTKTFSAGDVFAFNIDSISSITNINLTLKVQKT